MTTPTTDGALAPNIARSTAPTTAQTGGIYSETLYRSGLLQPAELPGVSIDLDTLFA